MHPKRNVIDAYTKYALFSKYGDGAANGKIAITHKIPLHKNLKKTGGNV